MDEAVKGKAEERVVLERIVMPVFIDGVEYVAKKIDKTAPIFRPKGATHWAETPDGRFIFYDVTDNVLIYGPMSESWTSPRTVPYTLYCFDDFD